MRTKSIFTGSCCAMITPFDKSGNPDWNSLDKIVDFLIDNNTDAICVCGTTGEASTMDDKEHLDVIEYVVKRVNGRVPVIAGAGSNDTRHGINLAKEAENRGADSLLLVTPYYNKATQTGLIKHYSAIADSVSIPIIVYNVPGRTGVNVLPKTLSVLADHPNIAAVKEASGNMAQVVEVMRDCGDRIDIYSGCDEINVPIMSIGGKGAISVLANIAPNETHQMLSFALNGNYPAAAAMQTKALKLINALFCEVNPIPVKEAMNILGFDAGIPRLPLCEMADSNREILKNAMKEFGLI
ncbi:MAG: 4-hydroxy-tetrahydrodipicolinate synthase [Clostridia bacterium]|nr:4-hydroxy-tetrahydrodipicolinate synthase [Clostridia bacterium]